MAVASQFGVSVTTTAISAGVSLGGTGVGVNAGTTVLVAVADGSDVLVRELVAVGGITVSVGVVVAV